MPKKPRERSKKNKKQAQGHRKRRGTELRLRRLDNKREIYLTREVSQSGNT